ncbi:MAG: hypothetical protein PVG41_06745 [Desulfobacteraceae bacterium]|jgi:hypothetical protein
MYIHTYQIHNVLNAYRKQLSQNSIKGPAAQSAPHSDDRINISAEAQNPKIVNDISSQIIDRITKFGPKSEFDKALADQLSQFNGETPPRHAGNDAPGNDFTYTKIDERNHKTTSKLEIQQLTPLNHSFGPKSAGSKTMAQQPEDVLVDNDEKDVLKG